MIKRSHIILGVVIVITIIVGTNNIMEEYQYTAVTGKAIGEGFNIEAIDKKVSPNDATAIMRTGDHRLIRYVDEVKDMGSFLTLKPSYSQGEGGGYYLSVEFDEEIIVLSLYMKKQGAREGNFEIWTVKNKKIGEGSLTNEFKWYNFDVTPEDMASDWYTIYNSEGETDMIIDQIYAVPSPRNGLSEHITGLFYS